MQATLIVVDGAKRTRIQLKLPTTIGRGKKSKLRVRDSAVSRRHCEVFELDDHLFIRDLGSSNGTIVNGQAIAKPMALGPEDSVSIGPVTFRFESTQNASDSDRIKSSRSSNHKEAPSVQEPIREASPHSAPHPPGEPASAETEDFDGAPFDAGQPKAENESAILNFRLTEGGSELNIEDADQFLQGLEKIQPKAGPSVLNDLQSEPAVDSDDSQLNQFLRRI